VEKEHINLKEKSILLFLIFCAAPVFSQLRSFEELFPGCDAKQKEEIFSPDGIMRTSEESYNLRYLPPALSVTGIEESVREKRPSFLVESIIVIPFDRNPPDLLGVYNGVGRVRGLKGRTYSSFTRKSEVALFEDATRIESARKLNPVEDPLPARTLPGGETIFMRLKDVNFGNSYYRADISFTRHGLVYNLSNFRDLSYLFIKIIKVDNFFARFYMEPLAEGVLLYSVSGAEVSSFVAQQVDIPSAVVKRLRVITGWVIDGLKSGA
jgi:hypothetical protein